MKNSVLLSAVILLLVLVLLVPPASAYTTTIQPSNHDAGLSQGNPTTNYGSDTYLNVGNDTAWSWRALFSWDLMGAPSVGVSDAEVQLYKVFDSSGLSSSAFDLLRVDSAWTEGTVTWNTKPGVTISPAIASTTVTTSNGWYSWNVTSLYNLWILGSVTNNGVELKQQTETTNGIAAWATREYSTTNLRPKLVVTNFVGHNYTIYLNGNTTTVQAGQGDSSLPLDIALRNTGGAVLTDVDVRVENATSFIVAEQHVTDIAIGATKITTITVGGTYIPAAVGNYSWTIRGNYTDANGTVLHNYTFNLQVVNPNSLIRSYLMTAQLLDPEISLGGFTTLRVTIVSTGTVSSYFTIQFTQSLDLVTSPSSLMTGIVLGGATLTSSFTVYGTATGLYTIIVRVVPVNLQGDSVGPEKDTTLALQVRDIASVTTLSVAGLGPQGAILQGKINSLGGLQSATVYFVIWATATGPSSAVTVPTNGEVVTYISGYTQSYQGLSPSTNYTYEFRLAYPGGEIHGGLINFRTPSGYTDPLTAIKDGLARGVGVSPEAMGFILGMIVIAILAAFSLLISDEWIIIGTFMMIGVAFDFAVGWWGLWALILIFVWFGIMIVRLPQFRSGNLEGS